VGRKFTGGATVKDQKLAKYTEKIALFASSGGGGGNEKTEK